MQHAVALGLPGARYRLVAGLRAGGQPSTTCVPWSALTPAQLFQYQARAAGHRPSQAARNCSVVVVAAAGAHAAPFGAVMRSLQFAGFRKAYLESRYLRWGLSRPCQEAKRE